MLFFRELGRGEIGVGAGQRLVGGDLHRFESAGVDQPADDGVADPAIVGEFANGALATLDGGKRFFALRR